MRHSPALLLLTLSAVLTSSGAAAERPVSFNRDIRPLLSDRCFACHGPDAETVEGGLRLDSHETATEAGAITPGDASESEMIRRLLSSDEDVIMPPPHLHKPLQADQIELIRRWINEGAEYQPHWAYTPLQQPKIPPQQSEWERTEIDRFIAAKLREEAIEPSSSADAVTLLRRLSFDLTGLPPTPDEVSAFIADSSSNAYEKQIKRLLASDRYGERMAVYWLDLVRYADTVGYHGDQDVSLSPYRDYVIDAFNQNLPYNQFVAEQLAGDLLDNPTTDQLIASGYNRLNQTTEEGGAQAKEYLAIYFADRVRNVSQVFMGATVGCAQCHDHKYDPYTAKDFYSLGAFFADLQEVGKYGARSRPPEIPVPTEQERQQLEQFDEQITLASQAIEQENERLRQSQAEWEKATLQKIDAETKPTESVWLDDVQDTGGESSGTWDFVSAEDAPVHRGKRSRRQTGDQIVQHFFINAKKTVTVQSDTRLHTWVYLHPDAPPLSVMIQFHDGKSWDHRAVWGQDKISYGLREKDWDGYRRQGDLPEPGRWHRLEIAAADVGMKPGDVVSGMAFIQFDGTAFWDSAASTQEERVPTEIVSILQKAPADRTDENATQLTAYYLSKSPSLTELQSEVERIQQERKSFAGSIATTLVSKSVTPRTIRILPRGNWMDDSGEIVEPAVPEFLGRLPVEGRRATRLDLAEWLCRDENLMTARTMVNRLWYLMFGQGIAASVDDLGGQGTFPTHPELLDYLANEFIESSWDIKAMMHRIAMSQTYRQSSLPSDELKHIDPYNQLLARQGRFRVSAEMVRDTALLTSGLLVEKVGGVSVKPYQPAGYYSQLNFPRREYAADGGEDQYRRGVYTHWQRTFLHPMLKAFDAPSREECTAMRPQSNTPLQALTLLNDPTFVEAARSLADRIMREGGESVEQRIGWAYHVVVSHPPDSFVMETLSEIYQQHLEHFQTHPDEASKLISTGQSPIPADVDAVELAAWTSVARTILNLHETYMRY